MSKRNQYGVGVHQKDLPTPLNLCLGFGHQPPCTEAVQQQHLCSGWQKILETIGNLGCILQQMGDVEGFICPAVVSGQEFTEVERMLLSFTSVCACLPA